MATSHSLAAAPAPLWGDREGGHAQAVFQGKHEHREILYAVEDPRRLVIEGGLRRQDEEEHRDEDEP